MHCYMERPGPVPSRTPRAVRASAQRRGSERTQHRTSSAVSGVGKACALLCSPGGSRNLHSMKEDIEENDNAIK